MRSAKEITFRLRQEIANRVLSRTPPPPELRAHAPLELLPAPQVVAEAVRGTPYAADLLKIADEILRGRVPIFDTVIDYGRDIAWRRDPQRGTETSLEHFRAIPYLDLAAAGDHKWVWEINRHQHLVLLAQAFVLTGERKYLAEVERQLRSWWAANPFHRGINWTSALEVAFRALSWIWIWHLAGEKFEAEFRQQFLAELYRHGRHLEYNLSIYFSPNTHLLGEAVALHAIGRLFPTFPRAAKWRQAAGEIVRQQMSTQVKPDGSHFEQSTYYHVYALDFFLLHAVLEEVDGEYRAGLARMTEFLAAIVAHNGELAFLGDDDGGRVFHPYGARTAFARATLAAASIFLGKPAFGFADQDVHEIALWWLGPQKCTQALPPVARKTSRAFADSGIVVMKRGEMSLLFDCGPFGPWSGGHSHADSLSVVLSVGKEEILIDPGTFSYLDPEWREVFRGTAAHNTVRIDGRDQATAAGPFRWQDKPKVTLLEFSGTPDRDRAVGECRYRGFTHKRSVTLAENGVVEIVDELDGPPGEHGVEQFWHAGPPVQETTPGSWQIGDKVELFVAGGVLEAGWRSRGYGSKEPSQVVLARQQRSFPAALTATIKVRSA